MEKENNYCKNMKRNYIRFNYSEDDLEKAISAIQNKELSLCKASTEFKIPKGTLSNKIRNKVPLERKMGPCTFLTTEEESKIKKLDYCKGICWVSCTTG